MAADFPPNLDDGELWLPSDIIPDVGSRHPVISSNGPDAEAVARQLAALGFLDPYRKPNKRVPVNRPFSSRFGFGHEEYRAPVVTNAYLLGNASKPVRFIQPQVVDVFDREPLVRRGAVRRSVGSAQFFPCRVIGLGRSCAGTGVFLPRVSNDELRKKPAKMTIVEQQKQPVSNKMTAKKQQTQVMKPLIQVQPPTELALPQEWTY